MIIVSIVSMIVVKSTIKIILIATIIVSSVNTIVVKSTILITEFSDTVRFSWYVFVFGPSPLK